MEKRIVCVMQGTVTRHTTFHILSIIVIIAKYDFFVNVITFFSSRWMQL